MRSKTWNIAPNVTMSGSQAVNSNVDFMEGEEQAAEADRHLKNIRQYLEIAEDKREPIKQQKK